jgi:hypothetical protein
MGEASIKKALPIYLMGGVAEFWHSHNLRFQSQTFRSLMQIVLQQITISDRKTMGGLGECD